MNTAAEIAAAFRRDLERLLRELEAFPSDEMLWAKLPGISNSAGNLFLHLEGNLREYIGRQLGSVDYSRQRELEFSSSGIPHADLLSRIQPLPEFIAGVVSNLPSEAMDARYPEDVLGLPLSTRQFLIHLSGHLNYHLGQINYLRRILTGDAAQRL